MTLLPLNHLMAPLLLLLMASAIMVQADVVVFLAPGGAGGLWNGVCVVGSCDSSSPCSLPSGLLTISGDANCEVRLLDYDPMPPIQFTATGTINLNLSTSSDGSGFGFGVNDETSPAVSLPPATLSAMAGSPAVFPSSFSISASSSVIRFKHYYGLHNATVSLSAKDVIFEDCYISDEGFVSTDEVQEPTVRFFHLSPSLTSFEAQGLSMEVNRYEFGFYFGVTGAEVVIENFSYSSSYPTASTAFFSSQTIQSFRMYDFHTEGVTPFRGQTEELHLENGVSVAITAPVQILPHVEVNQFTLKNITFTMLDDGMDGYIVDNVKSVLFEKVKSASLFLGSFATLKTVEKVEILECDLNAYVRIDSLDVTSGNVEIKINDSRLSTSHYPFSSPLQIIAPSLASLATQIILGDDAVLEHPLSGYDISFQNHIIFPHPVSFYSITLTDGTVNGKLTAPSLEVQEEIRGGSFAGDEPSIIFDTILSVHATQFLNVIPSIRDDEIFYYPADRFGTGIQSNIPFNISKVWIIWNLPSPAVFSSHPVSYGLLDVSSFSPLPSDSRYNFTVAYLPEDPSRAILTFWPQPCPSPCANTLASISSGDQQDPYLQSLCSSTDQCFSELLRGIILENIAWNFGPLSILPKGSVSFLGLNNQFGNNYQIQKNAISSFAGDAHFNGLLHASDNVSLSIQGHTSIQSDLTSLINASLTFLGDFECMDLQLDGSFFLAGSQLTSLDTLSSYAKDPSFTRATRGDNTFDIGGSVNFTNVLASISSPSPSVQHDFRLFGATDLTVDGDVHFVIGGNLEFSEETKISIQPYLNDIGSGSGSRKDRKIRRRSESEAYFEVSGNAKVGGTMQVNLTNEDLQALNGTSGKLGLFKGTTITGTIELLVEANSEGCATLTGVGETQIEDSSPPGTQLLSIMILSNTDACDQSSGPMTPSEIDEKNQKARKTWPIIVGSVLGSIALISIIAVIVIIKVPSIKALVVPYSTTVK